MTNNIHNPLSFQIHDNANALEQDGVPRFVLSDDGKFMYMNDDFCFLADIADQKNVSRKSYVIPNKAVLACDTQ